MVVWAKLFLVFYKLHLFQELQMFLMAYRKFTDFTKKDLDQSNQEEEDLKNV